jgi:hypothetical protein
MGKNNISCKRIFGVTICKFANGQQITIPTDKRHGIPLDIYNSKKINKNTDLRKKIDVLNRKLNSPFLVREYDVEKHPSPDQVITIPTILIGNEIITDPNVNELTLLRKASFFSKRSQ